MTTNIDFRIAGESLFLSPDTEIQLEITNPLFETDTLPGTLVYPFTVPDAPINRRLLRFPGYLAGSHPRNETFRAELYLQGLLWRVGLLSVVKRGGGGFDLSFQTDAGDVQRQLVDLQLSDVDMGTAPLDFTAGGYTGRPYALPTVRNELFYPEDDATLLGYTGLVNAYAGGTTDAAQPVVPMPYLLHVLRSICTTIGYSLTGTFPLDAEIQRLVCYANQAVDPATGTVVLSGQMPDQGVPDFIKAVRAWFCLSCVFDPVQQELIIESLRDILADARYVDWTDKAEAAFDWEPNTTAGFWLQQTLDSNDDLSKNASVEEYQLKVGGAQEEITIDGGTLAMQRGPVVPGSAVQALLPITIQKGSSPLIPDEKDNRCSLRLLFYRGLQADAVGQFYPLASAEAVDYAGLSIGTYTLRWAGPGGLYEVWHKDWLDFRSRTELVTRGVRLRMADLLRLDPRRKVLIRAREGVSLAFWKSIPVTISQQDGIQTAQIPFYKI